MFRFCCIIINRGIRHVSALLWVRHLLLVEDGRVQSGEGILQGFPERARGYLRQQQVEIFLAHVGAVVVPRQVVRDERDQHLSALVIQQASADVFQHRKGFPLEIVEILVGVRRAPLLREVQQLGGKLLVRGEILRQELHVRTQRAEYLVLVLGKVDGFQQVADKLLGGGIRGGLCDLPEHVIELVAAEHRVLLLLVLDLLHKLLRLYIEGGGEILQLPVKLGVAVYQRLVQYLDVEQVLEGFHREGGILGDLDLKRYELAVAHLQSASGAGG